jgi:PAS domain S-box-containing protein
MAPKKQLKAPAPEKIPPNFSEIERLDIDGAYRSMIENAYEGIVVARGDKFLFVNQRMLELTGRTRDELLTESFIHIIHPDDRDMVIDRYNRRLKGEKVPNTYTVRFVTKEGGVRWILATSKLIKLGGQPAVLSQAADISQLRRAEEALRESEIRYRDIIDKAVVGVYESNEYGEILYINDAMARIFEYDSPEEVIGQNVAIAFKDLKDRDRFLEHLNQNGYIENFELEFVTQTGQPRYAVVTGVLHGDKITGMLMDITQRKKAEEMLRESRATLNTLINSTHDVALLVDINGIVLAINNIAAARFDVPAQDLIGKNIYELMPPDLAEARREMAQRVIASKHPVSYMQENEDMIFAVNVNPVLDGDGHVQSIAVFAKDITVLKNTEDALRAHEKQYRNIVDHALVGIFETDLQGEILYVNDAMAKIFEFDSPAAMIATDAAIGYKHAEDRKLFIQDLKKNGQVKDFEVETIAQNGLTKNVILSAILDEEKISGMIMDISALKAAEAELQKAHDELESRVTRRTRALKNQAQHLEEANTAPKVLLEKRDKDRTEIEGNILTNVKELVVPYLKKVKSKVTNPKLQSYLDILEANLNNVISPFSNKLSSKFMNLTALEIEVANLVKHGKSTKEIAELLNVSIKTAETHRVNIRRKLGITGKKANLRTYLLSLA